MAEMTPIMRLHIQERERDVDCLVGAAQASSKKSNWNAADLLVSAAIEVLGETAGPEYKAALMTVRKAEMDRLNAGFSSDFYTSPDMPLDRSASMRPGSDEWDQARAGD